MNSPSKTHSPVVKKWQIIDLVRTGCIISAMSVHIYSNVAFGNPWVCWLWGRFCVNGIYGVYVFFIVSGFLITHVIACGNQSIFQPGLARFYLQRIGRIWPLYFLCLIFGGVIFIFIPAPSPLFTFCFNPLGKQDLWFWLSLPTFLFNWLLVFRPTWDYRPYWMILWSLSIEEQFYLLYPLVLRMVKNLKNFIWFLGLVILTAISWRIFFYLHPAPNDFIQGYASLAKFDLIAWGILFYLAVQKFGPFLLKHPRINFCFFLAGLLILTVTYFGTRENNAWDEIFVSEALALGAGCLILGGLHIRFLESKGLKLLSFPGKYCFGCYLLHPTVLYFVRPWMDRVNIFLGFFLFIILITLVAAFSYHFFELPANRLIRKTFGLQHP